ncbi:GGDEF domain-containing response regulator [Aliiglaciecola lipolytica]|uniref:diguanylate cyclase n=1 Tax=Aliiglaciecola lipolytica E3 TaxID=1127673 RepID=K6XYG7_9ALTE|nr:diguanylate cyclase [Aliiglaciecola lipolytica]GAC16691.1 two-component system, cell cycle response regulator [Aliiglaciecola lipolytica E3]
MIGNYYQQKSSLSESLILIVEDEPISAMVIADLLSDLYQTKIVHSGEEALEFCKNNTPDMILLDMLMTGMSGLQTCQTIKTDPNLQHIPIIFITSVKNQDDQNKCWEAGAVDFVNKPVNGITLQNRVKAHLTLKLQSDLLRRMSFVDGLTGLYNRHLLDEILEKTILQSIRSKTPLSLLMIDIDWFKLYNDTYGHLKGDECLKEVGEAIRDVLLRPTDLAFRYGGEEFLCLLPDTEQIGAEHVSQQILEKIAALKIPNEPSSNGLVNVSIGIHSSLITTLIQANEIIQKADSALYAAKQKGRNQYAS